MLVCSRRSEVGSKQCVADAEREEIVRMHTEYTLNAKPSTHMRARAKWLTTSCTAHSTRARTRTHTWVRKYTRMHAHATTHAVAWDDIRQAVPAFLTIIVMPLTYSIAYGLITGLLAVVVLWLVDFLWESFLVLTGYYHGDKTMYHVWLDSMSHIYVSLNREHILVRDLPGYAVEPESDAGSGSSFSGSSRGGTGEGEGQEGWAGVEGGSLKRLSSSLGGLLRGVKALTRDSSSLGMMLGISKGSLQRGSGGQAGDGGRGEQGSGGGKGGDVTINPVSGWDWARGLTLLMKGQRIGVQLGAGNKWGRVGCAAPAVRAPCCLSISGSEGCPSHFSAPRCAHPRTRELNKADLVGRHHAGCWVLLWHCAPVALCLCSCGTVLVAVLWLMSCG